MSTYSTQVNGIGVQTGCWVDSHHGQYIPDILADKVKFLGLKLPATQDPRIIRQFIECFTADEVISSTLWEAHTESVDVMLDMLNDATEGDYIWEWQDGEIYLNPLLDGDMQRIYFDPADEALDGKGWNVVDKDDNESAVALRFSNHRFAYEFCREQMHSKWVFSEDDVTTRQLVIEINRHLGYEEVK